jgi:hypothetical protein
MDTGRGAKHSYERRHEAAATEALRIAGNHATVLQ